MTGQDLTAQEARAAREWLGFTAQELADECGVNVRTIERIEAGRHPANRHIHNTLLQLLGEAEVFVEDWVEQFDGDDSPVLVIAAGPDGWSAHWQRMVAMRVRERVPGLRIVGDDDAE